MKPPTLAEIEEMKRNGYEAETLAVAQAAYERGRKAQELCAVIEAAFAGVRLGDGVGLNEGQGMDEWKVGEERAALRAKDEKEDWRKIPSDALRRCNCALSYFDAEGMRFHLPAFLICDLKGEYGHGVAFCLGYRESWTNGKFGLLSRNQRIAVRLYLLHILHEPEYACDQTLITRSLDRYWVEPD